jgi:ankyrin repeat protein
LDTCAWLVNVAKCDWRALNSFGCNAAQWAAQSGDVAMCDWLNILGLDMTLLNNNGHSAVHKAAVKGQRETCEWLLTAGGLGAEHVRPDYHDGMTPAEMARLEGHDGLAAWLREREDEFKRHG